jgi:hypothetical protein
VSLALVILAGGSVLGGLVFVVDWVLVAGLVLAVD